MNPQVLTTKEKRVLAAVGAVGTGLLTMGSTLTGTAIVGDWGDALSLVTLSATMLGGALLGGVGYYKAFITGGDPPSVGNRYGVN